MLKPRHREYVKITKTFPLRAAEGLQALSTPSRPFRFVYISGEGATHTPGPFTPTYGRVKGETETALSELRRANPGFHASAFRPGFVDSVQHDAIRGYVPPPSALKAAVDAVLGPPIRWFFRGTWSPTEPTGRFVAEMAMGRWDGEFRGVGVERLGEFPVVGNVAFRRLAGLDGNGGK